MHGFDEFFGYLYHLDAMEDPCHPNYPQALNDKVGPRNMVHSWATDADDSDDAAALGQGRQAEDRGRRARSAPSAWRRSTTRSSTHALKFVDKAHKNEKPFFLWLNPTRMHVVTHLSPKYEQRRTGDNGWTIEEAGMAQLDDIVGAVMKQVKDLGIDDDTILAFTTDNGAENFTWPDGGQTPFAGGKGTVMEGGFRVPMHRALARARAGRPDRERPHLRARLVPDARRRGRRSQHRRRARRGQTSRRP